MLLIDFNQATMGGDWRGKESESEERERAREREIDREEREREKEKEQGRTEKIHRTVVEEQREKGEIARRRVICT